MISSKETSTVLQTCLDLVGFTDSAGYLGLTLPALFPEHMHPLTSSPHHTSFHLLNMSLATSTASHEIWMPPLHTYVHTHKDTYSTHKHTHSYASTHEDTHGHNTLHWSSHHGSVEMNLISIHEDADLIPGHAACSVGSGSVLP